MNVINKRTATWVTILLLFVWTTLPLWPNQVKERDVEEEQTQLEMPSDQETLAFLEEQMPLALELLKRVKNDAGQFHYEEVLRNFREQHFHYLDIQKYDGAERAQTFLSGVKMELDLDYTLHEYHEGTSGPERKEELAKKVRGLLRQRLEHEKSIIRMQLKLEREHILRLEKELEELEREGERQVTERANEMLGIRR
ncbi:MAG: hypothetical protein AAF546_06550 [Verrucomicrobiota bacterium]